jgi:hypothetical protein
MRPSIVTASFAAISRLSSTGICLRLDSPLLLTTTVSTLNRDGYTHLESNSTCPARFYSSSKNNHKMPPAPSETRDNGKNDQATYPDGKAQQDAEQHPPDQPILALPPTDASGQGTSTLDVGSGEAVRFDHLGPIVVNVDGTMSRISNWDKMTELEKRNTVRIISKRNKARMAALRENEGQGAASSDE